MKIGNIGGISFNRRHPMFEYYDLLNYFVNVWHIISKFFPSPQIVSYSTMPIVVCFIYINAIITGVDDRDSVFRRTILQSVYICTCRNAFKYTLRLCCSTRIYICTKRIIRPVDRNPLDRLCFYKQTLHLHRNIAAMCGKNRTFCRK